MVGNSCATAADAAAVVATIVCAANAARAVVSTSAEPEGAGFDVKLPKSDVQGLRLLFNLRVTLLP